MREYPPEWTQEWVDRLETEGRRLPSRLRLSSYEMVELDDLSEFLFIEDIDNLVAIRPDEEKLSKLILFLQCVRDGKVKP